MIETQVKERPIIFSGESPRAILGGHKTQTRRVVKGPWLPIVEACMEVNGKWVWNTVDHELTTPYGEPGDRLWLREGWRPIHHSTRINETYIRFKSDEGLKVVDHNLGMNVPIKWRSPIYMPRWASRITLEITDIRVERVQDIRYEDIHAEGIRGDYYDGVGEDPASARIYFMDLWDELNAKRGHGFDSNPWVWVIEFEMVKDT